MITATGDDVVSVLRTIAHGSMTIAQVFIEFAAIAVVVGVAALAAMFVFQRLFL